MESAVGYPLFVRELRGVSATPAGAMVIAHAARIFGAVTALQDDLESLGDRLAGKVRVGAFPSAMSVLVPRAVASLATEHPGLAVTLSESATPALLRDLQADRLQVAVIGTGTGLPDYDLTGLRHHRVYAGDLCVAVSVDHRLAAMPTVPVHELIDEPWVAGVGSAGDPQFAAWPTLTDPVIRHRVRSWPARMGLVAAGLGVCVLPTLAARSVPADVVCVEVDDPAWLGRRTLAVTAANPTDAALAVVAAIRDAARGLSTQTT